MRQILNNSYDFHFKQGVLRLSAFVFIFVENKHGIVTGNMFDEKESWTSVIQFDRVDFSRLVSHCT